MSEQVGGRIEGRPRVAAFGAAPAEIVVEGVDVDRRDVGVGGEIPVAVEEPLTYHEFTIAFDGEALLAEHPLALLPQPVEFAGHPPG